MKFKTIFTAAVLSIGLTASASAADYYVGLPGVEVIQIAPKNYVGVTGGLSTHNDGKTSFGVVAGRDLTPNFTVEAQYEYRQNDSHLATGNVLVGQQIGNIKPYGLVGAGYKWNETGSDNSVWVVGAGVKVNVTERVDMDARYRYVDEKDARSQNRVTLGVNYKF